MAPQACQSSHIRREPTRASFWRDVVAEFLATFFLMSVQCALPLSWPGFETDATRVGLGMGFIVCTMAWTIGDFGGGHMNPAVSIAMMVACKITIVRAIFYIIAQCAGALAGAGFVYAITPNATRGALAATKLGPGVTSWQGFLVEMWITCILVIVILGSTNASRKGNVYMATIPIGFAIALGIMSGIGYTGGSMNPARSLGPAVVMRIWDDHWVYWAGPIAGGLLAVLFYVVILDLVGRKRDDAPAQNETFDGIPEGRWAPTKDGVVNSAYSISEDAL